MIESEVNVITWWYVAPPVSTTTIARWGPAAVRGAALVLLLGASGLLLIGATRRWVAIPGLVAAVLLAVASARGTGKVPFYAAIGIAAVDVVLFALGGEALT